MLVAYFEKDKVPLEAIDTSKSVRRLIMERNILSRVRKRGIRGVGGSIAGISTS